MNEKRYGFPSLILALVALIACSALWLLVLLVLSGVIANGKAIDDFLWQHSWLLFWGWLPGLILVLGHILILRRPQIMLLKILIWSTLSLAIISTIMWIVLYHTNAISYLFDARY